MNDQKGKIYLIRDTEQVATNFKKREFVLLDDSNARYPKHILMQFCNDKCGFLDSFNEGDHVLVNFSLNGRMVDKGQGEKFYNNIEATDIKKI